MIPADAAQKHHPRQLCQDGEPTVITQTSQTGPSSPTQPAQSLETAQPGQTSPAAESTQTAQMHPASISAAAAPAAAPAAIAAPASTPSMEGAAASSDVIVQPATDSKGRRGQFAKGNRYQQKKKTSDLQRAQARRNKVARLLSEALTDQDIRDAVGAMMKVIREGAARDQVAAYRALMESAASRPTSGGEGVGSVAVFGFMLPPNGVIPQDARLAVHNDAPGGSAMPLIIDANDSP